MSENNKDNTPPYATASVFEDFIDKLQSRTWNTVTIQDLKIHGFSQYSAYSILAAAKGLGLVDDDGKATERLLSITAARGDDKALEKALQSIIEAAYSGLVNTFTWGDMTVDAVERYFIQNQVSVTTAQKAARFFVWLAAKAGYELPEKVESQPSQSRSKSRNQASTKVEKTAIERTKEKVVDESEPIGSEDLEGELIKALIHKIRTADQLPSTEMVDLVRNMIEKKERRHSDSPSSAGVDQQDEDEE